VQELIVNADLLSFTFASGVWNGTSDKQEVGNSNHTRAEISVSAPQAPLANFAIMSSSIIIIIIIFSN